MKVILLGTAAADGWPAAYCDCEVCEFARAEGGKNLRMRTGALIDGDLKIDHSPDSIAHTHRVPGGYAKVRTILFTHEHPDHLFTNELKRTTNVARDRADGPAIAVYGNERVLSMIRAVFKDPPAHRLDLKPALVQFERVTLSDGTEVLPLAATHCEDALLYRIARGGKSVFYGHDSGIYKPETLEALGKAGALDLAILDCTHTVRTEGLEFKHHMSISINRRMIEELRGRGAVTGRTRLVATHFSPHSGAKTHEELVGLLKPHGIEAAYDGMELNV
jgi:phosphoribosyl 1,2-cyclic phosphate phosphodiesterase